MVSKASEDLPEPLRPVITVRVLRGISTSIFLRLCWRAPRTEILVIGMKLAKVKLAFRNMDGPTEMVESRFAQLYSRILVANSGQRQRG